MNKKEIEKKLEEVKAELGDKDAAKFLTQIQQNIHFNSGPPIDQLTKLADKNPELAKDLIELEKSKAQHIMNLENEMIGLEKIEQPHRHEMENEKVRIIKRGQIFAISTIVITFGVSIYFGALGYWKVAGGAIVVGGLVVASNFLGIKNKAQK